MSDHWPLTLFAASLAAELYFFLMPNWLVSTQLLEAMRKSRSKHGF